LPPWANAELAGIGSTVSGCGKILAGGGGFGRLRFFALRDFRVVGFDFCDGNQPATELTTASTEVSPLGIQFPAIGGDAILLKLFLASRQLGARTIELPFQILSFHSHLVSIASNRIRVRGSAKKRGEIVARIVPSFNAVSAQCI